MISGTIPAIAHRFGTEGSVVRIHSPRPLFLNTSFNFSRFVRSVPTEKAGGSNRLGNLATATNARES